MERVLTIPRDSNEAFRIATQAITPKKSADILDCSITHIYRMSAGKFNGEQRNHVFTQAYNYGKSMIKKGLFEALYVAVDPIVRLLGGKIAFADCTPDKEHYHEEMVDLNCAISDLMDVSRRYLNGEATEHQLNATEAHAANAVGQFSEKARQEKKKRSN